MSSLQYVPACSSLHSDGGKSGVICGVTCCQNSEELDGKLGEEKRLGEPAWQCTRLNQDHEALLTHIPMLRGACEVVGWRHHGKSQAWKQEDRKW